MSETKHTPGPWTWPSDSKEGCSAFDARELTAPDGSGVILAEIQGTTDNAKGAFLCFDNPADAMLIAAAPELLSACQAVVRLPGLAMDRATRAAARQCLAAITQAGFPPDPLDAALDACDGELELTEPEGKS